MKSNNSNTVLFVGDDESVYSVLSDMSGDLPISVKKVENSSEFNNGFHPIVVVEVEALNNVRLQLIWEITRTCSNVKIIKVKSGSEDKQKLYGLDVFWCLEKPVNSKLLSHSIQHALEIQEKDRIIEKMAEELKVSCNELKIKNGQLESLASQLSKTNSALTLMAENLQREHAEVENRVALNLRSIVLPSVRKLKKSKELGANSHELDLIIAQIEDITSKFITDARIVFKLTTAELKVASFIRNGLSTEEIARKFNVSVETIRSHRKRIRKKLGINKAGHSLKNFLESRDKW